MKLYYTIQILRVILMHLEAPDGAEGSSRSCSACRGEKGWKVCQVIELEKKGHGFYETMVG